MVAIHLAPETKTRMKLSRMQSRVEDDYPSPLRFLARCSMAREGISMAMLHWDLTIRNHRMQAR